MYKGCAEYQKPTKNGERACGESASPNIVNETQLFYSMKKVERTFDLTMNYFTYFLYFSFYIIYQ